MIPTMMTVAAIVAAAPAPGAAVLDALAACLQSDPASGPIPTANGPAPPGLAADGVVATPIAGATRAFSYRGTASASCGIALYGPVDPRLRDRLIAAIGAHPGWSPRPASFWDMAAHAPGAHELYWGDPLAPGLKGVALLSRAPDRSAPTIEVEYHMVLVR